MAVPTIPLAGAACYTGLMADPTDIIETDVPSTPLARWDTLFATDTELIRRLGVPEKIAYNALHALDRNPATGFPKKQALWANHRYFPAAPGMLWFRDEP